MFSGVVKIADIDDYITPSQNCIKPLLDKEKSSKPQQSSKIKIEQNFDNDINVDIQTEEFVQFQKPDLIKIKDKNKKTAKISLNDCLACNGCVTTAETLLIQAQSVDEFLKNSLNSIDNDKLSVICISPQSILSLAEFYSLTHEETFKRLCSVFYRCGVKYVFNFNTAIYLTLIECYKEFKERIINNQSQSEINNYIMGSECPGWVCYAEKKVGEWVIPYLSKIKSPQQILGHLIKKALNEKYNKEVYLTCIMPCFDKKLEATRETHRFKENLEVDTVISTVELLELFSKLNIDFDNENELNDYASNSIYVPLLSFLNSLDDEKKIDITTGDYKLFFSTNENYSSNGYSEFFISEYIKENSSNIFRIERKLGKNSDYKEILLYKEGSDKPVLSFCLIYGFRNIQNIIRNKNKIKYNYLEVMACPGGCINGGGQMRPKTDQETARDILKKIEEKINSALINESDLNDKLRYKINEDIVTFLDNLYGKDDLNNKYKSLFYTEFKALDKNSTLNLKW